MPLNNLSNAQAEVTKFSDTIDAGANKLANVDISVGDILRGAKRVLEAVPGTKSLESSSAKILNSLVIEVDNPVLKALATDVVTVLSRWFEDPATLCCLIQGIWTIYATDKWNKSGKSVHFSLVDQDWVTFLDILISFIDFIIVLLTTGLKTNFTFFIPDIIKEVMSGIIGGLLLVLQETLFAIRDSMISSILSWLQNRADIDNIWAKCLPFYQLLDIIRRYIDDYGIFAELYEKIRGYISGLVNGWSLFKKFDFIKNINDLEFLYWFRDLLLKLKTAALNFDLCVAYDFSPPVTSNTGLHGIDTTTTVPEGLPKGQGDNPVAGKNLGYIVASDGTILVNKDEIKDNTIPLLSNSSIRNFMNKYYGYPLEVVDNMLTKSTGGDSILGTDINSANASNINADCPNTPNPQEIMLWAMKLRSREK